MHTFKLELLCVVEWFRQRCLSVCLSVCLCDIATSTVLYTKLYPYMCDC